MLTNVQHVHLTLIVINLQNETYDSLKAIEWHLTKSFSWAFGLEEDLETCPRTERKKVLEN